MSNFISRWLDRVLGFGDWNLEAPSPSHAPSPVDPNRWPNWPAGSLRASLKLPEVKLYRYQTNEHLDLGDTWYRMVWDIDYKWHAAGRYSGQDISPGHFFSLRPEGARAEMDAYKAEVDNSELLEFTLSIDNLLDLTNPDALTWFYHKHFTPSKDWHWAVILDSLFAQQLGGDNHNAYAGHRAVLDGYNGIVFFGARAIAPYWPNPGSLIERDWDLISYNLDLMREDEACINVVIYFGHNVVQATKEISAKHREITNPLFGASYAEIDTMFAGDPSKPPDADLSYDDLRSRVEEVAWLGKPGIIETESQAPPSPPSPPS